MKKIQVLCLAICMAGCAGPVLKLSDGAKTVKVAKSDPADNYSEIGPITVSDGGGCGPFGAWGTYDSAIIRLKNAAYEKGADYVQLITLKEPRTAGDCDMVYKISGTLFKKTNDSPSPLQIVEKSAKTGSDKLRELKKLLDDGIITKEEFDSQKHKILESGI